jgi:hypothetical protein
MRRPLHENVDMAPEWRRRAERLRLLAKVTRQPALQADLVAQAQQWDGLARVAEGARRRRLAET